MGLVRPPCFFNCVQRIYRKVINDVVKDDFKLELVVLFIRQQAPFVSNPETNQTKI